MMKQGQPGSGLDQGSTAGEWIYAGTSPYLGDLQWEGPGFQEEYDYEWYDGCWAPCTLPNPNCIFLTSFKEDHPQK